MCQSCRQAKRPQLMSAKQPTGKVYGLFSLLERKAEAADTYRHIMNLPAQCPTAAIQGKAGLRKRFCGRRLAVHIAGVFAWQRCRYAKDILSCGLYRLILVQMCRSHACDNRMGRVRTARKAG